MRSCYLRVYLPAESFPAADRERWQSQDPLAEPGDAAASQRWLVAASLPNGLDHAVSEGAYPREFEGKLYLCPWHTRLRMLAGLIAFRGSIPDEVADAFVPETEARRAARELANLSQEYPDLRSHMLHANWHVPLRWFAAFDPSERVLVEDRNGLRIRYETKLSAAKGRLEKAVEILAGSWIDDGIVDAVRELVEWIEGFAMDGLLELDYGTVAKLFDAEDLVEDRSAEQVWSCLEALSVGDPARAGKMFGELTDRWTAVRAQEAMN